MTGLRRGVSAVALLTLAACTTNSAVDTGETASRPTAGQIHDYHVSPPVMVNPYIQERPPPRMGRDGCSTSIRKERGAIVIPAFHPDEVYCFRIAALSNTTLRSSLQGARLQTATSAMLRYLQIKSANTVDRDVVLFDLQMRAAAQGRTGRPATRPTCMNSSTSPHCRSARARSPRVRS